VKRAWVYLALLAVAAAIPLFVKSPFWLGNLIWAWTFSLVAVSTRPLMYMHLINAAPAALMGIGAYTAALMATELGLSIWLGFLGALAVPGLVALLIGLPVLRIRGVYFIVMTLAFNEVVRLIITHVEALGGAAGVGGIPRLSLGPLAFTSRIHYYYFSLFFLVLGIFFLMRLDRSRFGKAWKAIRENESLAEAVGINLMKYKLIAFVIGSMMAGAGGWLFAHYFRYISPLDFGIFRSIDLLIAIQFGGIVQLFGSVFGGLFLVLLPEFLRIYLAGTLPFFQKAEARQVVFGAALMVAILFFPGGAVGLVQKGAGRLGRMFRRGQDKDKAEVTAGVTGSGPS